MPSLRTPGKTLITGQTYKRPLSYTNVILDLLVEPMSTGKHFFTFEPCSKFKPFIHIRFAGSRMHSLYQYDELNCTISRISCHYLAHVEH